MGSIAFYNASKAAIKSYSESLRLEMAPLGVKVVTVVAGLAQTRFFENGEQPDLPADSPFKPALKEIRVMAGGSLLDGCMSAEQYAKLVTGDVLGGATGAIWRGTNASRAWFMSGFMPTWILVSPMLPSDGYF